MGKVCEDEKWNIFNEPNGFSVLGHRTDRNLKIGSFHFPPQKALLNRKSSFSAIFLRILSIIFRMSAVSEHIFMIR